MKIKIQGFRCHVEAEYSFNNGFITLISGDSGMGKSTILASIYWCLYGQPRTNILNSAGVTTKCAVTLELPGCIIYRQKKPELLRISVAADGQWAVYEDEVAQGIIDNSYGKAEVWLAASYIPQGHHCSLVEGGQSERMDLLNAMSFNNEDPESCISRIDLQLQDVNSTFLERQALYTRAIEAYEKQLVQAPLAAGDLMSAHDMASTQKEYEESVQQERVLATQVLEQHRLKGAHTSVSESLAQVTALLAQLEPVTDAEVTELAATISSLELQSSSILNHQRVVDKLKAAVATTVALEQQLAKLAPQWQSLPRQGLVDETIWQVATQEAAVRDNMSKCQQAGCDYSVEAIAARKDQLQNLLEAAIVEERVTQTRRSVADMKVRAQSLAAAIATTQASIDATKVKYNAIAATLETTTAPDVKKLYDDMMVAYEAFSRMSQASEILSCPACTKGLRYKSGKLELAGADPVTADQVSSCQHQYNDAKGRYSAANDQVSQLQNQIHVAEKMAQDIQAHINMRQERDKSLNELTQQITALEAGLAPIDATTITTGLTSQQLRQYLAIITECKYVPVPPIGSAVLKALKDYTQAENTKVQLEAELSGLDSTLSGQSGQILTKLASMREDYKRKISTKSRREDALKQQSQYAARLADIVLKPEVELMHSLLKDKIPRLQTQLTRAQYALKMETLRQELEAEREVILALYEDVAALQKLKQSAINVECKQLQLTVDSINNAMSNILTSIFDEPISVSLAMFKALKSDKRTKPNVNLTIAYKGAEYDSISRLSGGEAIRVSLALLLALSSLSQSPFVMLDECLPFLNAQLREACIKAIRTNTAGMKIVLIIGHEDVEGHYDDVVRV